MANSSKKVATSNDESTDQSKVTNNEPGASTSVNGLLDPTLRKKRVFFNGSSYSGADIKVLVHKYKEGPSDLLNQLDTAVGLYAKIVDIIDAINPYEVQLLIDNVRATIDTQEEYTEKFNTLWKTPVSQISRLESNLGDSHYQINAAHQIRSLTTAVQQSPERVLPVLQNISAGIRDLLNSWRSQRSNIEKLQQDGRFFQTKTLAELQTISVSTFREKTGVRSFGRSNVQGYVRGQRTIAGSMIFTVFDRNVLLELLDFDPSDFDADNKFRAAILDQLPPLDVTIQFANEYGSLSRMTIYGVEFVSEGQTMSIEDILLENVVQYVARDVDPMTPVLDEDGNQYTQTLNSYNQTVAELRRPNKVIRATDLIGSDYDDQDNSGQDMSVARFRRRSNPFL